MILAPKYGYIKGICVKSLDLHDDIWGDCSIIEGNTYELLVSTIDDKYTMVKFRNGLCPHLRIHFKTKMDIRDDKINSLIF